MTDRFAIVPAELITNHWLSDDAFRVFLALALHANRNRICWPSQQRIATILRFSRYRVRKAIDELEAYGFIEVEHRKSKGWTSSSYLLYPFRPVGADDPLAESPLDFANDLGDADEENPPTVGVDAEGTSPGTNHLTNQFGTETQILDQFGNFREFR